VVMDARGKEVPQSRRLSIKRPWEEDETLPGGNAWHSTILSSIDAVPYRKPSTTRGAESEGISNTSRYGPEIKESVAKRARHEGSDYNDFRREGLDRDSTASQFRTSSKLSFKKPCAPTNCVFKTQIQCIVNIEAPRNPLLSK